MTAHAPTQQFPWWKRAWRRLTRERPFWQKRLVEGKDPAGWIEVVGIEVVELFARIVITGAVLAVMAQLTAFVFYSPGVFEHGLADPLARLFAQICVKEGQCDLRPLMGGAALGVTFIVAMYLLVAFATHLGESNDDEPSNDQVLEAVGTLDERIVHLRADLVLAGVLQLSPEEKAEVEPVEPAF